MYIVNKQGDSPQDDCLIPSQLGGPGNPLRRELLERVLAREGREYKVISGQPEETFEIISRVIENSRQDPDLIALLRLYGGDILRNVPHRGKQSDGAAAYRQEIDAIWEWAKKALRYTKDPVGIEWVMTPARMIEMFEAEGHIIGDCDDFTVLLSLLMLANGHPVEISMVAPPGDNQYRHIYILVSDGTQFIPFDATNQTKDLGWEMANGKQKIKRFQPASE